MITIKQIIAIFVALIAATIVFKIPPYSDDGGIIGGTVYYPFSNPPADDIYISPNLWLLKVELSFVALALMSALAALRRRSPRRQQTALLAGLSLEAIILGLCLPSFNTVLAPECTFYLLNLLALLLLAFVIVRGTGPNPDTNPDQGQYPV